MSFNIGIIGTGYVGLVTGTCFASTGNNVLCIDIVKEKVEMMKSGKSPIYEPGLDVLLQRNVRENRLNFSTDLAEAVRSCLIIFLCLPTPPNEDGSADLQHVLKVTENIVKIIKEEKITEKKILVNKSTVPVGTVNSLRKLVDDILPNNNIEIASNPEFLREGFAIEDAMKPERIVVGTDSQFVRDVMTDLYQPFVRSGNPIYFVDIKSAEVIKYAANSFLAVKISFMNDLSAYCEAVGADIDKIRLGIGSDSRIGKRFLFAGIGYGGSCFPKDVKALIHSSDAAGKPLLIVKAAQEVNELQAKRFFDLIKKRFKDLKGKHFGIWGLAFKPETDDTREAPAFKLIQHLLDVGASVTAYDPEAIPNTKLFFGEKINYAGDMYECTDNKDALIIATEWTVFRNPNFNKIKSGLKQPIIFDGRNLYGLDEIEKTGFEYYSIGRKYINAKI